MRTEESNKSGAYYNFLEPKDEASSKPLHPHWTTTLQAYYNSGSTPPTPLLHPLAAGSYLGHYGWPNQANKTTFQYDSLHDHMNPCNNSTVVGVILNQQQRQLQPSTVPSTMDAASIFSEKVRTMFGGKCDRSLQPKSSKTKESRENENKCSAPSSDKDGLSVSEASGSKESPHESHDTKNVFPSTKKHERNVTRESASSIEQNKNSGIGLNASSHTAQLAKQEEDEIRKERKRKSNRESAKRSRMRRQKECEELHRNMDNLKGENSALTQRLMRLSEECLELRNEIDSTQDELVTVYGEESISDLLPMKPA